MQRLIRKRVIGLLAAMVAGFGLTTGAWASAETQAPSPQEAVTQPSSQGTVGALRPVPNRRSPTRR